MFYEHRLKTKFTNRLLSNFTVRRACKRDSNQQKVVISASYIFRVIVLRLLQHLPSCDVGRIFKLTLWIVARSSYSFWFVVLLVYSCKFDSSHQCAFPHKPRICRRLSFVVCRHIAIGRGDICNGRIWSSWMICLLGKFVAYVTLDHYWFMSYWWSAACVSVIG
jgi:hypothetical protein